MRLNLTEIPWGTEKEERNSATQHASCFLASTFKQQIPSLYKILRFWNSETWYRAPLHLHRLELETLLFLSFFLSSATLLSKQFKDNYELPIDQVFFSIEQNESVLTHVRNVVCAGSLVLKRFFPCRQKKLRQHKLICCMVQWRLLHHYHHHPHLLGSFIPFQWRWLI